MQVNLGTILNSRILGSQIESDKKDTHTHKAPQSMFIEWMEEFFELQVIENPTNSGLANKDI